MVNETADVPKIVETGSGGTTTIDWTTYCFSQPIDLSGQPILASLENTLFDVYSSDAYTAKVLWDKLDRTHHTDSQGFEKYYVARFLDFKLVDGKSMTEQVHEFEMLVHDLGESGMVLLEKFRVISKANVVTVGQKRKVVTKKANTKPDKNKAKKPKTNKPCWSCGRVGHWSKDCPSKKAKKAGVVAQANTVLGLGTTSGPVANMVTGEVVASGTDDGYVTYNPVLLSTYLSYEWLIDTGANVHICADISLFVSYQQSHGVTVTMGNASAALVLGIGNVDQKFASGRILSLTRMHHVPSIRRNIISGSCLVKNGFELSLKCNKVVITHTGTFFGKGYLSDGLFLINVEPVLGGFINDSVAPSVNCVESSDLWHLRLGHLNLGALKNMLNLELIPKYAIDKKSKCQVCVTAKQTRKPFHIVVRDSDLLDLVHSYICEFGGVLTKDHCRYFITFIDDCSRYCYVYLLKHKNEALDKFIMYKNEAETQIGKVLKRLRSDRGDDKCGVDPGSSSTPNKVEEPRRSKHAKVVKDFGSDFITYNIEDEPLTFRQAKDSSESRHWKSAVKSEIDSIVSNGTWELVDLPPGCSIIGCKWIFKRKLNPDGSINKYKARLVAKGFRQREGIDYFDTYSPVARMTTIRMLIALAFVHGLIIHQMDVKTTFLHGDLEEEIYMDQPEGFVASGNERKTSNFLVNESDKCVYYKVRGNDCVIVCLYVDDILLFGTNIEIINETKSFLKRHFEIKDMGEASVILGIKLTQSTDGITLSQSHYIEKSILEKYGYSNCRIASTPYDSKVALVKTSSGVPVSQLRYTSCPNKTHWEALDRVLRYLKGTISLGLHYRRFPGDNIADPLTKGIEHVIVLKLRLGMGLYVGLQFAMSLVENAPDWLRAKLESAGTDELILIAKVLWSIWFFRNKKVCEGKQVDSRDAMGWGTRFFVDWRLVKAQTLQISTTARSCHTQSVTKWSPPSVGAYKLNTDATNVVGAAGFSIGLVIRDHVRIFVAGMVKAIRSRCSVLEAEIVAIREGLRWLEDFTFSRVEVESDSLLFVQAINSPQVNLLEIGFIIDECRDILECRTASLTTLLVTGNQPQKWDDKR
ncbi:hypothetical protein AgCh_039909 [Apium graveolens]